MASSARTAGICLQEGHRLGLAEGLEVGLLLRPAGEVLARLVTQGPGDLLGKLIVQAVDQIAHVVGDVAQVQPVAPPVAGKDDVFQAFQDLDDRFVAGQRAMAQMGDRAQLRVGLDNFVGQFGQGLFDANVGRHGMIPEVIRVGYVSLAWQGQGWRPDVQQGVVGDGNVRPSSRPVHTQQRARRLQTGKGYHVITLEHGL